jgi:VanZ family protein
MARGGREAEKTQHFAGGLKHVLRFYNRRVQQALRVLAVCSWILLAVLSLVPGQDRPHTGMTGNLEHTIAYFLAAFTTRLIARRIPSRWQLLAFSACAVLFEICQIWIPGRSAGMDNWAASSLGALLGIVSAKTLMQSIWRRAR